MKVKKIPLYFSLSLFTLGSSLILGFLSFTGMFNTLPILPLAIAAFVLSVSYEGEVYLQNIKGAFTKLFKQNYFKNHLAKEYLLKYFPQNPEEEGCPQFFRDYAELLKKLNHYKGKKLNKKSKEDKEKLEKHLKDMEQWFALELFNSKKNTSSPYTKELQVWLAKHSQKQWQDKLKNRQFHFRLIQAFSLISGIFMGLSSTYLMVEAFSAIPFFLAIPFTFWPIFIVPLALIAGAAYSLLTLNAITEMVNNNTLIQWYKNLSKDLKKGVNLRNVFLVVSTVLLGLTAIGLTICTAGTWWTIANKARPLFDWMKKIPSVFMGVINPLITGFSSLFFISQNTAESLEVIDDALKSDNLFKRMWNAVGKGLKKIYETENWLQMLNPFRILIKLTITPLRILLFFGHLVSIAVTTDRMPGFPQIVAFIGALISEGIEDLHYFNLVPAKSPSQNKALKMKTLLKEHLKGKEGQDHELDIPTKILTVLAQPLYFLAACWDALASCLNKNNSSQPKRLTFKQAWDKQRGIKEAEDVPPPPIDRTSLQPWDFVHADYLIKKQITKLENATFDRPLAKDKIKELQQLNKEVNQAELSKDHPNLIKILKQANKPVYNVNRLFPFSKLTDTAASVGKLPERAILSL